MSNSVLFISIVLASLLCSNRADSQKRELTLDETIHIACEKSFEAFKNDNFLRSRYYRYMDYLNLFKPTLSLQVTPVDYSHKLQQVYDSDEKQMVFRDIHNLSVNGGINLSQNIKLTGGRITATSTLNRFQKFGFPNDLSFITTPVNINYSQSIFAVNELKWKSKLEPLALEKAKQEYIEEREAIAIKSISLYFSMLSAESSLIIAQNNYTRSEYLYEQGEKRYNINSITLDELYQLDLRRLKAKNTLNRQKNSYETAKRQLLLFIELPHDTEISCSEPGVVPLSFIAESRAIEQARIQNPVYYELRQQAMQAQYELQKARAQRFNATLNLGAGLNKDAKRLSDAYIDPLDTENVRLGLSVPIVDWGKVKREIHSANVSVNEIAWKVAKQEQQLDNEVLALVREFNIQKEQLNNAQKADSIARITYKIVEERFMLGRLGVLNLNDAQNEMELARNNYILALKSFWQSYFELRKKCLYDFVSETPLNVFIDTRINELINSN